MGERTARDIWKSVEARRKSGRLNMSTRLGLARGEEKGDQNERGRERDDRERGTRGETER